MKSTRSSSTEGRDQLAAAAMIGILAAHSTSSDLPNADEVAENAYGYADAMIRKREADLDKATEPEEKPAAE